MKSIMAIGVMGISLSFGLPGTREIFTQLNKNWNKTTPESFSARVRGPLIAAQLRQIPQDKIEFKKKPVLKFFFKKGVGHRFVIENVDAYYKNYFSIYEDLFKKAGIYITLGKQNTYSKFIGQHRLYWLKANQGYRYKIKIIEKDALPGDFGIFYLNDHWKTLKSEYFENAKKVAAMEAEYVSYKQFELVKKLKLEFTDQTKTHTMHLLFGDFSDKKIPKSVMEN